MIVSHFSFIKRHDICIDYFSFKNYATEKEDEDISLRITLDAFPYAVSEVEDFILNLLKFMGDSCEVVSG